MKRKKMVTGAGGFIGGHLVKTLLAQGEQVIGVDIKPYDPHDPSKRWWQEHREVQETGQYDAVYHMDAGDPDYMPVLLEQCDDVYHLAEDMGGIGFIESHRVDCLNSVVTSVNLLKMLDPAQHKLFFSSSACAYNTMMQNRSANVTVALKESMAWPAMPEAGYGLQKLYIEELCKYHFLERGLETRVARFHNSYGPKGSWVGGREKAPAAICRKVAYAQLTDKHVIDIWGDGTQTRSFMYIDDNIHGILQLMESAYNAPMNIGSAELVTIDRLVDTVESIAFGGIGVLQHRYQPDAPRGVAGRNSDNTLIESVLGWEPSTSLIQGLAATYPWVLEQVRRELESGKLS